MKYKLFKRELVLGVVILFLVSTFGASIVPGDSKNLENQQIQHNIKIQKDKNLEKFEFITEEHMPIQISGTDAYVSAYKRGGQIKRLYGEAFSQGESPEESAEKFIQSNAQIFNIEATDLVDQYLQPIMYIPETDDYKFTGLNYVQYKDGIPVFRSRLILLVKNVEGYPLVHASVDLHDLEGFSVDTDLTKLNPELGINNAIELYSNIIQFSDQELVIWAGVDDKDVQPKLSYSFIGDNGYQNGDSSPEKYLFIADAETGDILYIESQILNVDVTGNVKGKATQGFGADICGDEVPEIFKYARVNIGSEIAYTDENGNFTIPNSGSSPVTVESRLWGEWFRVYNQAGGDTVLYLTVTPPGPANFMHNDLNNDEYKRAEVNGYYHANIVRDFTLKYNPSYPGLDENEFPVNVNINDYCNAYYDYESINFFRAGGGCPNTAFSTIIHHEYGHHLVAMAGSGQGEYGEGMSDVMGVLITDNPGLAYGFFSDCDTPLRNASNTIQYPCSGGIHYCGQLLSGCVWETRNELVITNPDNYTDIISNLAVNAMLLHTGISIDPTITIDYLTLDDDNGNIYDGTPHYEEIATGFGEHNMDAPPLSLLGFEFPDGLPEIISPVGGTTVRVIVYNITADPKPNTGILHFDDGSGWIEYPMTEIEPNVYDAVFPGGDCQSQGFYYFSANSTENHTQVWPADAPDEFFTVIFAYDKMIIMEDDFETDLGWTVENDCNDGEWERGIPIGWNRGDPPTDYDESGNCYLTDNDPYDENSDVDDGYTWLISPIIDLSGFDNAKIEYALWYTNNFGNDPNNDRFYAYASNNGGTDWTLVNTIGPSTPIPEDWKVYSFMIGDFITPTDQVKVRFEASDLYDGSVVEAGIDAFSVIVFDCVPDDGPDLDSDGDLTWIDVKIGETVTSTIIIENIGEPGSLLDWEVIKNPTWGDWTFSPSNGEDLKPEDGPVTVQVEVVAPDEPNQEFVGEVKIVNSENGFDYEILPVTLQTPKSKVINLLFQRLFQQFPNAFPILRQLIGL